MSRRIAAIAAAAAVAALLLTGCAPQYATPDERSESFAEPVAEAVNELDSAPEDVQVRSSFDGIVLEARLGDMSYAETRAFIEQALPIVEESPLGTMPVRLLLSHTQQGSGQQGAVAGSTTLEWRGYDPARADRYFAAVQVWLDTLADPGVQFDETFQVQAAAVFGDISVVDGRDLDAYSAEITAQLEKAGYVEPRIIVAARPAP